MMQINWCTVVVLFALGCSDDKNESDDTGFSNARSNAEGSGCEVVEETPLALDGTTPTGVLVSNTVAILEAEHTATLTWNDGTSTGLTVTITDVSNPRYEDYEVVAYGSGDVPLIEIACIDQLVLDIQLSIVTEDGQLNESLAHTAAQSDGSGSPSLFVDLTAASGSFDPAEWTDETYDRLAANLTAEWIESGIRGQIDGFGERESGQVVSATRVDYATFGPDGV